MIIPHRAVGELLGRGGSVLAVGKSGDTENQTWTKHTRGTSSSPLPCQVKSQDPEEVLSASSRCESRLPLQGALAVT